MTSPRLTESTARDCYRLLRTISHRSGGANAIRPGLPAANVQHHYSTSRKRRAQSWNGALNLDRWSRVAHSAVYLLSPTIHWLLRFDPREASSKSCSFPSNRRMSEYGVHHCSPCSLTYAVQVLSTSFNRSLNHLLLDRDRPIASARHCPQGH